MGSRQTVSSIGDFHDGLGRASPASLYFMGHPPVTSPPDPPKHGKSPRDDTGTDHRYPIRPSEEEERRRAAQERRDKEARASFATPPARCAASPRCCDLTPTQTTHAQAQARANDMALQLMLEEDSAGQKAKDEAGGDKGGAKSSKKKANKTTES